MKTDEPPLLSRPVAVAEIPAGGLTVNVVPTDAERAALATFNGLVALKALRVVVTLTPEGREGVRVTGDLFGEVTQTCVVSGEAFDAPVREDVDVHFLAPPALEAYRAARAGQASDEEVEEDEPDQIRDGQIDLGALAAEHLTLGLDPYPRKPGAALAVDAVPEEKPESPFAVLKSLGEK